MKRAFLWVGLTLLFPVLSFSQWPQLPAEELWRLNFDTTTVCLGSSWHSEGHAFFLVGLKNRAVLVRDGEITWESNRRGTVYWATRVNFGRGLGDEFLVLADSLVRFPYNGMRLDRYRNGQLITSQVVCSYGADQIGGSWGSTTKAVVQLGYGSVDSSESVELIGNYFSNTYGNNGRYENFSTGAVTRIHLAGGGSHEPITTFGNLSCLEMTNSEGGTKMLITAGVESDQGDAGYNMPYRSSTSYLNIVSSEFTLVAINHQDWRLIDAVCYDTLTYRNPVIRAITGDANHPMLVRYGMPALQAIQGDTTYLPVALNAVRWLPYQSHPDNQPHIGYFLFEFFEIFSFASVLDS